MILVFLGFQLSSSLFESLTRALYELLTATAGVVVAVCYLLCVIKACDAMLWELLLNDIISTVPTKGC